MRLFPIFLTLWLFLSACGTSSSDETVSQNSPSSVQREIFLLRSEAGTDGGTLPTEYTCDGAASSPALLWANAPAGTQEFAVMMTTLPGDGTTKWNWIVYDIPASATNLPKNNGTIGRTGTGSHGTAAQYDGPCSQGPGAKWYTFTIYALSESPSVPVSPELVTGPLLTDAISKITLGRAVLNLSYTRP